MRGVPVLAVLLAAALAHAASGPVGIFSGERKGSPAIGRETVLISGAGVNENAGYSPDGRYVYFNSDRGGSVQVWRVRDLWRAGRRRGPSDGKAGGAGDDGGAVLVAGQQAPGIRQLSAVLKITQAREADEKSRSTVWAADERGSTRINHLISIGVHRR